MSQGDQTAAAETPSMSKGTIYIAGPMRGVPYYNFPAFDAARDLLSAEGWQVMSPADLDRAAGFDAMRLPAAHDWQTSPDGFCCASCIDRDIAALRACDAIYLLDGWERSAGARAEKALAEWLQKRIMYQRQE